MGAGCSRNLLQWLLGTPDLSSRPAPALGLCLLLPPSPHLVSACPVPPGTDPVLISCPSFLQTGCWVGCPWKPPASSPCSGCPLWAHYPLYLRASWHCRGKGPGRWGALCPRVRPSPLPLPPGSLPVCDRGCRTGSPGVSAELLPRWTSLKPWDSSLLEGGAVVFLKHLVRC